MLYLRRGVPERGLDERKLGELCFELKEFCSGMTSNQVLFEGQAPDPVLCLICSCAGWEMVGLEIWTVGCGGSSVSLVTTRYLGRLASHMGKVG